MADWNKIECELVVHDYLVMYEKEMRGQPYSKAEHRRALKSKLNNRSDGSIEFKHQNISAVMLESGYPYIKGYKPAKNYQSLLKDIVLSYLSANSGLVAAQSNMLLESELIEPSVINWERMLTEAPERGNTQVGKHLRDYSPKQYNYSEQEASNRKLGAKGEELVINFEKYRLSSLGRDDLAKEIEWTSKDKGDGAGYDIRSFDGDTDRELFIEVKSTYSGKYQPFFISDNEVSFSETYAKQYSLYRVYQLRDDPKIFTMQGNIKENVTLQPKTYRAIF